MNPDLTIAALPDKHPPSTAVWPHPRHGGHRATPFALACGAAAITLLLAGPPAAAQATPATAGPTLNVALPPQPLDQALAMLARQYGLQMAAAADLLQGRQAPRVQGAYTAPAALAQLLQGSGLRGRIDGRLLVVDRAPAAPAATVAVLPVVRARASQAREAGTGPIAGYGARRSATATKTDTPLLETPQSVSVIGAEQIADLKATSIAEVLAYTPGVLHDPGYSNSYDVFYSRGFRMHDGSGSIYRDGLKLGGSGWATGQQEPYGFERVELLKGAASLLYGAASPGGVLNVVTKRPQPQPLNELVLEAGNQRHRQLAADLGLAWSSGEAPGATSGDWAARLVVLARDADTSIDHVPNDARYLAPSLRWSPNSDTSLTLLAHHAERRTAYIWGLPAEGSLLPGPQGGRLPRDRFVGEPGYDRQDTRQSSFGWLLEQRLGDGATLHHGLRWIDTSNHVRFSGLRGADPANPVLWNRVAWDELETTRGISTDTHVQLQLDTGALKHQLLAGIDAVNHHIGSRWLGADLAPLNLAAPQYGAAPGAFSLDSDDAEHQKRIGLYLQDQVKLGALTALAGVRRDEVRSSLRGAGTEKTGATTGRVGLVYEIAPGLAPFASWSQSFEPQSGTDNEGRRYRPTRGEQFELGLRWQRGNLVLSAAAYELRQTEVKKRRAGLPKPVQTGEVRSRGIELEAKGELVRDVQLIASYAYTDAVTTRSERAAEVGLPLVGQPKQQAAVWTRVDHWFVRGLHAGLGVRRVGRTEDWEGTRATVPAFTTLDALLGYTTGAWTLRLNVSNLGDRETLLCNGGWCVPGDGRRATASVAYRW